MVNNSPQDYKLYEKDAVIITDFIKNKGPLGGIHAGLSQTSREAVFFVACDMPFLHNDIICSQIRCFNQSDCDCLVPRLGHFIEPLHAIYKKGLSEELGHFLKTNHDYSVRRFLKTINVQFFDLNDSFFNRMEFTNINTPEEKTALYENKI